MGSWSAECSRGKAKRFRVALMGNGLSEIERVILALRSRFMDRKISL